MMSSPCVRASAIRSVAIIGTKLLLKVDSGSMQYDLKSASEGTITSGDAYFVN